MSLLRLSRLIYCRRFKFLRLLLPPVLSAIIVAAAGCDGAPQTIRSTEIFGTQITIIINGLPEEQAAAAIGDSFLRMEDMHRRFHAWRAGELTDINRAVAAALLPLTMSAPMATMMMQAADYAKRSGGLFNPAAGQLFSLWGMHADAPPQQPPSSAAILSHMPPPRMRDIKLSARLLQESPPRAQFDFGGTAKGAALDETRRILRRHGVRDALINVGGNIMALGENKGEAWRVRLHPAGGAILLADGEAVATSGDTARFFVFAGRRYHHIIDPRSGYPSTANAAASVISDDPQHAGAISDAAATALMIANEKEARQIVKNFALAAALQVGADGKIREMADMSRRRYTP